MDLDITCDVDFIDPSTDLCESDMVHDIESACSSCCPSDIEPSDDDSSDDDLFSNEATAGYMRYTFADPVCETLQNFLDSGVLDKESIFFKLLQQCHQLRRVFHYKIR